MKVDPLLGVSWLQLSEASMTESVYGIHAPVRRHGTSVVESKGGTNQSNAHNIKKNAHNHEQAEVLLCKWPNYVPRSEMNFYEKKI